MKKSELVKIIKEEIQKEGRIWPVDLERIDQENTFDDKVKLIWMWIRQNKIGKWTQLSDVVRHLKI